MPGLPATLPGNNPGLDKVEDGALEQTKLHIGEQRARALLGPLLADLADLERRTRRHATRLHLGPDDQARLDAAVQALQGARATVQALWESADGGDQ
jgi:hypothetical protein